MQDNSGKILFYVTSLVGRGIALASIGTLCACANAYGEMEEPEAIGEATSAIGEATTRKVIGAVGISGSNMLGANRLTLGPCPATPFKTPSASDSTIKVASAQLGDAKWDCLAPEFFFGANRDALVSIAAGLQEFKFIPPAGYKCDWTGFYEQSIPKSPYSFSKSGNNCTTTLNLNNAAEDVYLWFFVKPTLTYKVAGAVGISGSNMLGPNRLTQGPCPGTLFKTASSLSSTITVGNAQLGQAKWECGDPSFYFGDALNKNVSLDGGTQVFEFAPPAGYTCEGYSLYGTRNSESFSNSGAKCSVTVSISANPGDLYIWFYVKPT